MKMNYTINNLAKIANISVRTLHYYDQINLLKPAYIGENGYRYYSEKELAVLQQILFFRELEFPLEKIKEIITNHNFDVSKAMVDHKNLLKLKIERLDKLLHLVDKTISNIKGKIMEDEELFESFDEKKLEDYKKEALERWGSTKEYKQSMEQTKNWSKEEIARVSKEWTDIAKSYAEVMGKGVASDEVQEVVKRHWDQIDKFYDCTPEIFQGLAQMYASDERFARNYNKFRHHLAESVRDAMLYYCDCLEK